MEEETTEKGPEAPPEPPAPRIRKFGCGHMALCGLGLLLLAGGIWYAKLCAARKEFLRHAEALVAEVEAGRPAVPEEENAAELYREAFKLYVSPRESGAKDMDAIYLENIGKVVELRPEVVNKFLQDNEPYIAALRKAVERPKCDFRPDFWGVGGLAGTDDDHSRMRSAARFLGVAARVKAHEGKPEEAGELLSIGLRVSRDAGSNDTLIPLMVQLACEGIARAGVENLLEDCDPNAALIERLLGEVEKHSAQRRPVERVLFVDRACMLHNGYGPWVSCRESAKEQIANTDFLTTTPWRSGGRFGNILESATIFFWQHSGYVLRDARQYEAVIGRFAAAAAKPYPQALEQAEAVTKETQEEAGWWAFFSSSTAQATLKIMTNDARAVAKFRTAQLGLGCRLYKLKFGAYPDKLSDLSAKLPEHFKTLPVDPFNGKDMIYKRTDRGCKVYSVGDNRKDDGGTRNYDPDKKKYNTDYDWVFELKR